MAESTAPAASPRRTKRLLLFGGVGLLLVVLVAAALMLWQRGAAAAPGPAERAAVSPSGVVALEPFLVNLADRDSQRFARVTIRLLVDAKEEAEAIAADPVKQARLRSTVLELLTLETADRLTTADGKNALKKTIAERATSVLGQRVHDVLFTDFVVQ